MADKKGEQEDITNYKKNEINVLVFDLPPNLFEKIFPKHFEIQTIKSGIIKKNFNKSGLFDKLFSKNKLKVNWVGYLYPELKDDNYKQILLEVYNFINNNVSKKFIIIKHGKSFINEFAQVINKIKADKPLIFFNLKKEDEIDEKSFQKFNQQQFVSYYLHEEDPKDPDKNYNYIVSYLWEKDCFYNELGNSSCQYSPANLLYKKPRGFLFYNILLTGESRAGKSSLINRMFNKAVTFESSKVVSTTLEITHYEYYPDEVNRNEKKKITFEDCGGINIFDTPGLVKSKNLNSLKKMKKEIDKFFDNIHIIYFFLRKQSNLDNSIELLKFIKTKNDERVKNKLIKVPIIFIRNGDDLNNNQSAGSFFQHLKNELKKNGIFDLYDDTINQNKTEINDADDLFSDESDTSNNYSEFIDGNIIQIYLPKGQNVDKIFSTTNIYFMNSNKILFNKELDNDWEKMRGNTKRLIELYTKKELEKTSLTAQEKEEYTSLYNECNIFVNNIKKDCNLLYNFELLKVKSKEKLILGLSIAGFLYISGIVLNFFTSGISVLVMLPIYFLSLSFAKKNLIKAIATKHGFSEKDLENYGLKEHVFGKQDDESVFDEKSEKEMKKFFINLLYFIGPIQCLLKARESLLEIYESFDLLGKRSEGDWNVFKAEKI